MGVHISHLGYLKVAKILFVVFLLFGLAIIIYFPHYARVKKIRHANDEVVSKIQQLETEIDGLRDKIKKVKVDASLYERIAREEMGVMKEDEVVIDVKE